MFFEPKPTRERIGFVPPTLFTARRPRGPLFTEEIFGPVNHSSEHIPGAAFGGMKNSGLGREESLEEIESYTQHKNVYIRY